MIIIPIFSQTGKTLEGFLMHYLDHAATTPVPREVADAMYAVLTEQFGNALASMTVAPPLNDVRRMVDILHRKICLMRQRLDEDEMFNEEADLKEAAEREAMRWHIVRSGDTLYGLALANKTTVSAICRWNGISEKSTLRIGQKLRVR